MQERADGAEGDGDAARVEQTWQTFSTILLTGLRRCRDYPASRHHAPKREASLLIDHRTYRIKPTHMNTHLAIYEEFGLKAQWRHLGEPHAYMFAESGAMNSLVHQWVYKDAADREKRRAAMAADPDWQVYVKKLSEFGPADGPADLADGAGEVFAAVEEVAVQRSDLSASWPGLTRPSTLFVMESVDRRVKPGDDAVL